MDQMNGNMYDLFYFMQIGLTIVLLLLFSIRHKIEDRRD